MPSLQSQLDNETARHQQLKSTGRNDYIAQLVLKRIETQITKLKRRIDNDQEKARNAGSQYCRTCGSTRYAEETSYRGRFDSHEYHYSVSTVPAKEALFSSEGAK